MLQALTSSTHIEEMGGFVPVRALATSATCLGSSVVVFFGGSVCFHVVIARGISSYAGCWGVAVVASSATDFTRYWLKAARCTAGFRKIPALNQQPFNLRLFKNSKTATWMLCGWLFGYDTVVGQRRVGGGPRAPP